jgi:hypothetical protein
MNSSILVGASARVAFVATLLTAGAGAFGSECANLSIPNGQVIWCDSFEDADLPPSGNLADNYFDYDSDQGDHVRVTNEAADGSYSLRQRFQAGEVDAGHLFRTFGRNPVSSLSHSQTDFREIYWRLYVKHAAGTTAYPNKLARITVFASPAWAQAMIGHVWLSGSGSSHLAIDPASGTTTSGTLVTTQWNDFANLRWLGLRTASLPLVADQWQCIETRVALNSAGASDGVFQLWIDGQLAASRTDLNWLGSYSAYGLNAISLESYWNGGATAALERFVDGFVIATNRIGCTGAVRPSSPTNLTAN